MAKAFSYIEAVTFSYKMFFRMLIRTYFLSRNTQARLTPKRFALMSFFLPMLFLLNTMHWIGFVLDEIFFPGFRKVEIKTPLFIVGIPRSGTSYMHRLVAGDTDRFTTLSLWELILAPSVSERKVWLMLSRVERALGGPVSWIIKKLEHRTVNHLDEIHKISITDPEEDYLLLVPLFACYLMILPFPFFDVMDHLAYFDDLTPAKDKKLIMDFYTSCLKRHLYVHGPGKQLLSKNVSFAPMVGTLNEYFPDCRIVCNVRNPIQSIPSHVSSMLAGGAMFDNDPRGWELRDQMIALQRYAFSHVLDVLSKLPQKRHIFVRMEDLKKDVYQEIKDIYDRFGYEMSFAFREQLKQEKKREQNYKSGHTYSLSSLHIEPETIESTFADVMDQFGYKSTIGKAMPGRFDRDASRI